MCITPFKAIGIILHARCYIKIIILKVILIITVEMFITLSIIAFLKKNYYV